MIRLQEVSKRFGSVQALASLTMEIAPGEMVVLQGPSGSGKTTILRLIAGLELPDSGQIFIDGQMASEAGWGLAPYRRGIGIVFQRSALWPHMTVAENLLFVMDGLPRQEKRRRLQEVLSKTDLKPLAGRLPEQLSGGEARRTALARAIAACPKRLLLDEPLTNLDPQLKLHLLKMVLDYVHEQHATLLFITHELAEASAIGGRIVRLEKGRLV